MLKHHSIQGDLSQISRQKETNGYGWVKLIKEISAVSYVTYVTIQALYAHLPVSI